MMWSLVVLVVISSSAMACPEGCSCHHNQDLYVATCSLIPYSAGKVEVLNIRPLQPWNSPQELTDGQFNQAKHLKYLNLRNNSLYFIHKKAFYGAKGLLEIDLSFNYIEELEPTLFQLLTSLTTLKMRGNPVQLPSSEVPFVISNSIQHLDLGQCKLKSIPMGVFYGLKRLRYLLLDGNHLKFLKYNTIPKGLKHLNLSKNLIVNVPLEVLSSLTNLKEINLSGNPINCSCSLMNLQDWLSTRGVVFEDNVICAFPPEYSGISLSKVNENNLCLAETRRDETLDSAVYSKLTKNKLNNQKYFDHENSYSQEFFQSDQPQAPNYDLQAEVLFKNDKTIAMGEMMRDEENRETLSETDQSFKSKDVEIKTNQQYSGIVHPNTSPSVNTELKDLTNTNRIEKNTNSTNLEEKDIVSKDKINQNVSPKVNDDLQEYRSSLPEDFHANLADESNNLMKKLYEQSAKDKELIENTNELPSIVHETDDEPKVNEEHSDRNITQSVSLNGLSAVEYKHLSEENQNDDVDDLKKEGFLVHNTNYKVNTSSVTLETTDIPLEDTTEEELTSSAEPPSYVEENYDLEDPTYKSNSPPETINGTSFSTTLETISKFEVMETISPPVMSVDLSTSKENKSSSNSVDQTKNSTESSTNPDINLLRQPSFPNNSDEQKREVVAEADVLMFCIGVLLICLILYSVYKCRSHTKSHNIGIAKDIELNHGTELQDLASLLPISKDDFKKSNLNYYDKGTSSENVKLITEQNENTPLNSNGDCKSRKKIDDKNSFNNNTSPNPTNNMSLVNPRNKVTIDPAAPIQRTKVKIGIIPDSIPRTPIFLKKTDITGTKYP